MLRISLKLVSLSLFLGLTFDASAVLAQEPGEPVELALPAPMRSLKTVPTTQELLFILRNPGLLPVPRRQSTVDLPPLAVHALNVNPLTGLELTLLDIGTADQEISHDISFTPNDPVGTPVGDPAALGPSGPLVGNSLGIFINEEDFIRGRPAAIALGKALFWDMQVGSDGVQSCGSCHFHAGADSRTRGQLNPNTNGPLGNNATFETRGIDQEVTAADFPFHKLFDIGIPGEPLRNPGNVRSHSNDVMSSMGVSRFKIFDDIPGPTSPAAFLPAVSGVAPLAPDLGTVVTDPVAVNDGFRRVEPRNTPTIFGTAFNFDNFWDARARHDFNGGSVQGAADPQFHVFANDGTAAGALTPASNGYVAGLRQAAVGATNGDNPEIDEDMVDLPVRIRLSSIASLSTGPVLSNFEMSFDGRNWPKMGKKLLQAGVTPLANQLVADDDSVLGIYSNQGGSACAGLPVADRSTDGTTAVGKPGLCISYPALIRLAFYPNYWANTAEHLEGTAAVCASAPVNGDPGPPDCDPFDGYLLGDPLPDPASPTDTNQFSQLEANMSLFFGLGVQAWVDTLIPDDTHFDKFLDANPQEFLGVGFVPDIDAGTPGVQVEGLTTRQLQGFDLFTGSNHSLLNPEFKSARCGMCHNAAEMTDHSNVANHAFVLADPITGQPKVISGYFLEDESGETAQDAVEIDNISFDPITGLPTGHTLLDNGVYNIGVTPIEEDVLRGGTDAFGFPLSLAALALQNAGCPVGSAGCDPAIDVEALFVEDETGAQLPAGVELTFFPTLPDYYLDWANEFTVGEVWPQIDRTVFIPDFISPTVGTGILPDGTFPNANRVGRMGNAKAPSLRNVELSGPYFHNGGQLTLRQVVDFYGRGGDFGATNAEHLDPQILRLNNNTSAGGQLSSAEKDALVDFLISLTDERVRQEMAPFDHPEVFVPLAQNAPENLAGRATFVGNPAFLQSPAVGEGGRPAAGLPALGNFLGVSSAQNSPGLDHFDAVTAAPIGTPPVAVDDSASTKRNSKKSVNVLSNDRDPDGSVNRASIHVVEAPANGTARVEKGSVRYTPATGFVGFDSFRYAFLDNLGNPSNVATVRVLIK